jgi:sugar O-acyltransferase (sialic acid O-acetyltransferase NeuD family)
VKDGIVLFGSGGNARVLIDMIRRAGRYRIVGLIDDNPERRGDDVFGEPVLGGRQRLKDLRGEGVVHAVNAVGSSRNNGPRTKVFHDLLALGFTLPPIVHPSVILGHDVQLGAGSLLMAGVIVNPGTRIGRNCLVNTGSVIEHDCVLDDHVFVGPGCALAGNTRIGEGAFIGIGANAIQSLTIGKGAVVAGGAMVIRDVGPDWWVMGVPARRIR